MDDLTDNALHATEALFCTLLFRVDSVAISYSLEGYGLDIWLVTCASDDRVYKQELPVSYRLEFRWIKTNRIWEQRSQMLHNQFHSDTNAETKNISVTTILDIILLTVCIMWCTVAATKCPPERTTPRKVRHTASPTTSVSESNCVCT